MKKILQYSASPLAVGITAALLIILDSFIARLFFIGASFIWITFISWAVFFNATNKERFKAIIGFIIGWLAANLIIWIGDGIEAIVSVKLIYVTIASIVAFFLVNTLIMYLDRAKKFFLDSIFGIFVGIAITFSGAGYLFEPPSLTLLAIILIYGILGLLAGWLTNIITTYLDQKWVPKKKKTKTKKA